VSVSEQQLLLQYELLQTDRIDVTQLNTERRFIAKGEHWVQRDKSYKT